MTGEGRKLPGDVVGRGVARIMAGSARHAKLVFILSLLIVGGLSLGISNVRIDQDLSDGLPESNPNKRAFDRLMNELPGVSTLEAVLFELDPEKAHTRGITDIRHQDSIRAIEEAYQFFLERVPELSGGVSLNHVVKQVRTVLYNNDDAYYEMPLNDPVGRAEFDAIWAVANNTVKSNIELTIRNPDYQSTVMAIQYDAELNSQESKAIGLKLSQALAEYRERVEAGQWPEEYDLFKEEYVFNLGPQSGLVKFEGHLKDELPIFVPAIIAFIFMCLVIGLRSPRNAAIGIVTLGLTTVATVGLIGWLKIPFTSQNITMIPLIMGNGIDYAIHVLNEYTEERSHGHDATESFRRVGGRAGVAMVIATTTSTLGILSLTLSSSIAYQQLAICCAFALLSVTIFSFTLLPSMVSLFGGKKLHRFKPSETMVGIYRTVNRHKTISILVFLGISLGLTYNVQNLDYFTDITSSNFPEDDQFVKSYLHLRERQQGSADELIIIEGDIQRPEVLDWIRDVEEELMTRNEIVASRAHVNSLNVLLGAYELLTKPAEGAPRILEPGLQYLLEGNDPQAITTDEDHVRNAAPTTAEAIREDIQAMQENRAWRPLIDFLFSKEGDMTIISVLVNDAGEGGEKDFDSLRNAYDIIAEVLENNRDNQPEGITVHQNGLSSGLYFFLDYSFTWLTRLFFVSAIAGSLIMLAFTKSLRATIAFVTPMLFTTTWVMGILPLFDILVGAALLLPLIFITSIGSDYSAHLIWDTLKFGHPEQTYRTAGKGILFSAITDFGAFFIFSFSYLQNLRGAALATALSILAIFVVTMLTVPLFFNRERKESEASETIEAPASA